MIKLTVLFLGLFHLSLNGMGDEYDGRIWYYVKLKRLAEFGRNDLVKEWVKKYNASEKFLIKLSRETNGAISHTKDPEIAEKDYNKFTFKNVMELTPDQIGVRERCVQIANEDYKGPRVK